MTLHLRLCLLYDHLLLLLLLLFLLLFLHHLHLLPYLLFLVPLAIIGETIPTTKHDVLP